MIEVSQMYKDTLASGTRNFNAIINITLEDGTRLPNLTNANLRAFSIDDAVSDDNSFTMLGSTIINQCSITLDNLSGEYFQYNFKYADVVVYIDYPLLDGTVERIRKGTFYVDDDRYVGGTVELTCFDNLAKLDKDYAISELDYPATIEDIILDACNVCGVEFSYTRIPYSDFLVPAKPIKEQTTFRQVVGWAAQIVGCYVRCDTYGRLELNWCNLTALEEAYGSLDGGTFDSNTPYETGDIADGGRFNPWNVGYIISSATLESQSESHQFYYNYAQDIAIEDIIISGVTIVVDSKLFLDNTNKLALGIKNGNLIMERTDDAPATFSLDESGNLIVSYTNPSDVFEIDENGDVIMHTDADMARDDTDDGSYSVGSDGYVITIEKNELITADIAQQVVTLLGDKLVGMRFRKASTNHMSDPTIEAGDIAVLWDTKNRSYPIIVTRTNFKIGSQQRTVCGVESPTKNSATRYTETAKAYLRIKEALRTEKTSREQAVNNLATKLAASSGLYSTIETTESGNIYYLHDRPDLDDSQIIWKMTAEAWGVSSDGGQTWNGGMTVDGDTIVRILSAVGVDADWIRTGIIKDRNGLNYINLENGNLQFKSSTSSAWLEFTNGSIRTYTPSRGVNGVRILGDSIYIYNWNNAGELSGKICSLSNSADDIGYSQNNGIGLLANASTSSFMYLGFTWESSLDPAPVLGIRNLSTTGSALYEACSWKEHCFRSDIHFERKSTSSDNFETTFRIRNKSESHNDVTLQGVAMDKYKFLDLWCGVELYTSSTLTEFGLNTIEYSPISIKNDVTIRGGYDIRVTQGSIELGYGGINNMNFVELRGRTNSSGSGEVRVAGGFSCSGTKNRVVKTKTYGTIALTAYETTTPYFGDLGIGRLDSSGVCYIKLDEIFLETVTSNCEYIVFLQKEGPGDLWIANKYSTYFEVNGTPNLKFAWEVKIKQLGYENNRLERDCVQLDNENDGTSIYNYEDVGFATYLQFIKETTDIDLTKETQ